MQHRVASLCLLLVAAAASALGLDHDGWRAVSASPPPARPGDYFGRAEMAARSEELLGLLRAAIASGRAAEADGPRDGYDPSDP